MQLPAGDLALPDDEACWVDRIGKALGPWGSAKRGEHLDFAMCPETGLRHLGSRIVRIPHDKRWVLEPRGGTEQGGGTGRAQVDHPLGGGPQKTMGRRAREGGGRLQHKASVPDNGLPAYGVGSTSGRGKRLDGRGQHRRLLLPREG